MQTGARYFSWRELAAMIVAVKLSMLTTYAPILTGAPATRDAWISAWLAAGTAFLIALVPYHLLVRFPGMTLFTVNMKVLGPWVGRAVNLIYALGFLYLGAIALHLFTEVFLLTMLPDTPALTISLLMILLVLIGVLGGIEVLGRLADLIAPLMVVLVLMLSALGIALVEMDRLLPLFEYGLGPMLLQTLTPVMVFGEMAWTVMLAMPYLREPQTALKSMWVATLINAAMVSFGAAMLIAMMGPHLIDREILPTLTAFRMVRVAEFLTRVEWILAALWLGSMYVKIGLLIWGAARAIRESLGLKGRRLVIGVLAGVILIWSRYVFADITQLLEHFRPERSLVVSLPIILVLPLLTLLVAMLRGLHENRPAGGKAHG